MPSRRILIATIGRAHGVRGLVRLHSYAEDAAALPGYGPFTDDRGRRFSLCWRAEGIAELAEIIGNEPRPVADRAAAAKLANTRLYADRDRLPQPEADEFYWSDLIGLEAVGLDGGSLGRVDAVHNYGAGASLEIGSLIVPFTRAAVPCIDLAAGRVTVAPPEALAGEAPT
jgi:16S rRNA processing protein RimM